MRKRLQLADDELRRVAQIARQTLGFYKGASVQEAVEIREVMEGVLQLYGSRLLGKQIFVCSQFDDCYVIGNSGELRQLFSNLYANSIDALPVQGALAVKSSRFDQKGSPGVRVTIADNGCGIAAENLKASFSLSLLPRKPQERDWDCGSLNKLQKRTREALRSGAARWPTVTIP